MLKIGRKWVGLLSLVVVVSGCRSTGTGALDLQGYPNLNVAPAGEVKAITPQEEYEMLAKLNAAMVAQPQINPGDKALFAERQKRLAQIAATHVINTAAIIEAR